MAAGGLEQVALNLSQFTQCEIRLHGVEAVRSARREEPPPGVHIAFRQVYRVEEIELEGCLLLPLADAISLAALLMGESLEVVEALRAARGLDDERKSAILELGELVARALDGALRYGLPRGCELAPVGCQGVASGKRAVLSNPDTSRYGIGRAHASVGGFAGGDWILVVPEMDPAHPGPALSPEGDPYG